MKTSKGLIDKHREFTNKAKKQMVKNLISVGLFREDAELQSNKYFGSDLLKPSSINSLRIAKDISTMKTHLFILGEMLGISVEEKDIKNSYFYSREVYFHFGRLHLKQTIETTYTTQQDLTKVYERLTIQAMNEKKLKESRLMEAKVFISQLYTELRKNINFPWKIESDIIEKEIYATINSFIDASLQNEEKLISINDLEKVEEVLERLSTQYEDLYLEHTNDATLDVDQITDKVDLTPLNTLYYLPGEQSTLNKISWKHVIKAYMIEKLLLMREYKRKISNALNYFCYIKEILKQDITKDKDIIPLLELVYINLDEVRLKKSNGTYIFLESALIELKDTMQRLVNCGSYYIAQYENKFRFLKNKAMIDRGLVMLDLLKEETKFVYLKVEVVKKLMYVYEHSNDCKNVGKIIHEFIERRPRLLLTSQYFKDSYKMECECLKNYVELLNKLIKNQIKIEIDINSSINRTKDMTYKLKNYYKPKESQEIIAQKQISKEQVILFDPYKGRTGETYNKKLEDIVDIKPKYEKDLYEEHKDILRNEKADKELKNLQEFIAFNEGFPITSTIIPYNHKQNIGTLYTSLAEIIKVLVAIRQVTNTISDQYQTELRTLIEKEIVIEAMKVSEELSIEVFDSPEILIDSVKELAKEFNCKNLYEIDPMLLNRLSVSKLNELNFDKSHIGKMEVKVSDWPTQLELMCNLLELIRLREQLLSCYKETNVLTKIYTHQKEFVFNDSLLFMSEAVLSNKPIRSIYVEAAICRECQLNYAIKEFDPELQNLLCFHNSKCIQLAVIFISIHIDIYFWFRTNKSCITLPINANTVTSNSYSW